MEMQYFEIVIKSFIAGVLSAYLLIYGLRPSVMYPDIILELFENQWMFIVLLLINYYLFIWDNLCGALLLLCIIALIFDYVVFTDRNHKLNKILPHSSLTSLTPLTQQDEVPSFEPTMKTIDLVSGTFQENMMNQLKENAKNTYNVQGAPSPFI